jgi:PAS domain-containing protein
MDEHAHHAELLSSFLSEQQQIFDTSGQAIYAFLDDGCIVCNKKFAALLEYSSPEEWAQVPETFTEAFVAPNSQATLVTAYRNAMEKMVGSTIQILWKKKSGGTIDTSVILVPIIHQGHLFAFHFISEK